MISDSVWRGGPTEGWGGRLFPFPETITTSSPTICFSFFLNGAHVPEREMKRVPQPLAETIKKGKTNRGFASLAARARHGEAKPSNDLVVFLFPSVAGT